MTTQNPFQKSLFAISVVFHKYLREIGYNKGHYKYKKRGGQLLPTSKIK